MSKVQEVVIARLADAMEKYNNVPWRMPWMKNGMPMNYISQRKYNGINCLLLWSYGNEFQSNWWMTYKQAASLGGTIKQGTNGFPVIFWSTFDGQDSKGNDKAIPFMRYYTVFNIDQVDGIPKPEVPQLNKNPNTIAVCEETIKNMPNAPKIIIGGDSACYVPSKDEVHCPEVKRFDNNELYYCAMFHELVHSTKHKDRLNRDKGFEYGDGNAYSKEELVAEIGSAFVMAELGIEVQWQNSATYLNNWIRTLKNDKEMLFRASGKASMACQYILNRGKDSGN